MILCQIVLTEGLRESVAQTLPLKHVNPGKSHPIETRKLLQMAFRSNLIRLHWKVLKLVLKVPEFTKTTILKGFSQESKSNFGPQTGISRGELYN